jgi:threonine aldolase
MITDLRSDTFTKPGTGMKEAMFHAAVGDDVFGEDPSVNQLEAYVADIFGRDAALFCPSGTMANQIAINVHTKPGNEVICEQYSHIYIYEGGGIAFNSHCQVRPLPGDRGRITAEQVEAAINPDDIYRPITSLVCVENTSNRGGGSCYEFAELERIKAICLENHLKFHLDGARIWNALIAKNETAEQYGALFDSISVCLSKGLGAPVGSVLVGNEAYIKQARRIRKVLGGGMRQAGFLAAAGIYAIENNFKQLKTDHQHARLLAEALIKKEFIGHILPVETNILIFEVQGRYSAASFADYLKQRDIWVIPISPHQVRMVTHLDVSPEMIHNLVQVIDHM